MQIFLETVLLFKISTLYLNNISFTYENNFRFRFLSRKIKQIFQNTSRVKVLRDADHLGNE